ncbi:malonate decarboxylase holo-[acyl-carrier-protein] synthase [Asaia prunellae]|uniref:malonate decarboxylase holo-[acyl-carrier-protein] synthase n=1 Tax=Asaia prunellae TaxID=610245 RepID=UPI00046F7832|nr:malonate decarboxylase holo-[acyl-carrier-protein] synthase [Asaia prunellae]
MIVWQRHDLINLSPSVWQKLIKNQKSQAVRNALYFWQNRALPLMCRRRSSEDRADLVPVCIAFPPSWKVTRLRLQIDPDDIENIVMPPALQQIAHRLPSAQQEQAWTISTLIKAETGLTPRLFGSVLWQGISGLPYLRDTSDLDLLWIMPDWSRHAVFDLVARLIVVEKQLSCSLDGEIVLPDGRAVHWREIAKESPVADLLVKTAANVCLMSQEAFFSHTSSLI